MKLSAGQVKMGSNRLKIDPGAFFYVKDFYGFDPICIRQTMFVGYPM